MAALHCILPDTEDRGCFSYVPSEDEAGEHGSWTRRYKVNRHNLAEHVYDGESIFYEADKWDVKDLVPGSCPEECTTRAFEWYRAEHRFLPCWRSPSPPDYAYRRLPRPPMRAPPHSRNEGSSF